MWNAVLSDDNHDDDDEFHLNVEQETQDEDLKHCINCGRKS